MQVVLPDVETRASFEVCGDETNGERPLSDEEFFDFCMKNPDLRIERDAGGEITIMPPAGFETGYRNNDLSRQLGNWAISDGRGVALDSSTEYLLASGAARSPDASWVLKSRLASLTKQQKKRFVHLCPDFVVELRSPSDRLPALKAKMEEWIENGAQFGWLIDAELRTVCVYRPGKPVEELQGLDHVVGEGPVDGFRLDLDAIWEGV
jgi:Uma2 family endonuclease